MDELAKEYYDTSRVVTREEAMRNLVSAILLRAVLDYRDMLVANVSWDEHGCDIQPTQHMLDMERFFKNMGFDMHKKLIDGVARFAQQAKAVKDEDYSSNNKNVFTCPICGGRVKAGYAKVRVAYMTSSGYKTSKVKKCSCQDCLLKMVIE